jgi:hypothetical protein
MKVISFFSRFAFICNIAFLLFVFFNITEAKKPVNHSRDTVQAVPFFKDLIITLGFSAIVINLLVCIVYTILIIVGKKSHVPKWLAILNFIFLGFQFYFFFF